MTASMKLRWQLHRCQLLDPIRRVSGVGEALMFGSQYAMRVWLNPDKLNSFGLTAADVTTAIENKTSKSGRTNRSNPFDQRPATKRSHAGANYSAHVPELKIFFCARIPMAPVLLKDVARVAFGAENYARKRVSMDIPPLPWRSDFRRPLTP